MLRFGDVPEVGGSIAPRRAVWEAGSRDQLASRDWARAAERRIARAYNAWDAGRQFHVDRLDGGQEWRHGEVAYRVLEAAIGPAQAR